MPAQLYINTPPRHVALSSDLTEKCCTEKAPPGLQCASVVQCVLKLSCVQVTQCHRKYLAVTFISSTTHITCFPPPHHRQCYYLKLFLLSCKAESETRLVRTTAAVSSVLTLRAPHLVHSVYSRSHRCSISHFNLQHPAFDQLVNQTMLLLLRWSSHASRHPHQVYVLSLVTCNTPCRNHSAYASFVTNITLPVLAKSPEFIRISSVASDNNFLLVLYEIKMYHIPSVVGVHCHSQAGQSNIKTFGQSAFR